MNTMDARDFIQIAKDICENTGSRLTETRQHMLEVLFAVDTPKSAYELTDDYNRLVNSPIMAMSVYRILNFLASIRLVHHLHSINKYIICKHPIASSENPVPMFLICTSCQQIEEVAIAADLIHALSDHAESRGFISAGSQIELNSLCKKCQSKIHQHSPGDLNGQNPTNK